MALCPRLSQLRAKKSSSNPKHGSSRAAPSPAKQFVGSGRALQPQSLGLSTSSLGLSAHILSLGLSSLSSPYFCWCGLSSPYPFFGAIQPIFFWCGLSSPYSLESIQPIFFWCLSSPYSFLGLSSPYPFLEAIQPIFFPGVGCPAHILSLGLSSPYSFGVGHPAQNALELSSPYPISFLWRLSSPYLFFWVCPAHILSLGLSSPYPFFGAIQPISFPWGCPAHIFSLELSSSYFCWCGSVQACISFPWGCPAHYPFFGAIQPIFLSSCGLDIHIHILSLGLSSPSILLVWVCPAHLLVELIQPIFFWVYPAHILYGRLSSPYPSFSATHCSILLPLAVGCPAHILSLGLSSPYSFGVGSAHFCWSYPAHILLEVYPAHILLVHVQGHILSCGACPAHILSLRAIQLHFLSLSRLSSPHLEISLELSRLIIFVGVGCPAHILGHGAVQPISFQLGTIQPIFFSHVKASPAFVSLGYPAHILLGLSLELSSPYFPWSLVWAVQPISFLWGYPAHILLVWVVQPISLDPAHILLGLSSPYSFGAVQPISFPWGCPAHILSLELSSPYPFLGAVQPISFLWSYPAYIFVGVGCPPHILSLGLSSPYLFWCGLSSPFFFGAIQPIFFWVGCLSLDSAHILLGCCPAHILPWSYPAHILLVWVVQPISLELSSPYSFGVYPAHILLVLSSPYPFLGAVQPCILSLELSSPYPFLGAVQPISFLWGYPAHISSFGDLPGPFFCQLLAPFGLSSSSSSGSSFSSSGSSFSFSGSSFVSSSFFLFFRMLAAGFRKADGLSLPAATVNLVLELCKLLQIHNEC